MEPLSAEFVATLLSQPSRDAQVAQLQSAGHFAATGMAALMAAAGALTQTQPAAAQALFALVGDVAAQADDPATAPHARYRLAQLHAMQGEHAVALNLIAAARTEFEATGQPLDAQRTAVGQMMVLGQSGAYTAALDVADAALAQLDSADTAHLPLIAMLRQNRGICQRHVGAYDAALADFAAAGAHYAALDRPQQQMEAQENEGVLLLSLGRGADALALFEAKSAAWDAATQPFLAGVALGNLGYARLQVGHFSQALAALETAYALQRDAGFPAYAAMKQLDSADAYLALNQIDAAQTRYAEAAAVLANHNLPYEHARALWGWGVALAASGQPDAARTRLEEAASRFAAFGNDALKANVQLALAALLAEQGQLAQAISLAEQALSAADPDVAPLQHFLARLLAVDLALQSDDVARAAQHIDAAALMPVADAPPLRYRLNVRRGHTYARAGADADARQAFAAAIDDVERLRGALVQEGLRMSFFSDKMDAFEGLMALLLPSDAITQPDSADLAAAFAVAEQAKSRALADLVAGAVDEALNNDLPPDVRAEMTRLRADLNALYNQLLDGGGARGSLRSYRDLNAQAHALEQRLAALQQAHALPSGAAMAPRWTTDALRRQLPPDVTLVAYHAVGNAFLAFVYSDGELHVERGLDSAETIHALIDRLRIQWGRLRAVSLSATHQIAQLERSARRVLGALYDALVAPLRARLRHEKVVIVPHGALHQIPFHALHDGESYLLDRYAISYAPSVTIFALCQARSRTALQRAAVFGVGDAQLPAVTLEAQAVADCFDGAALFMDGDAEIGRFHAVAPLSSVLHLACHAIFRPGNAMFSALKLHDGWLTAADVAQLTLPRTLVTLSACESGRSTVAAGDEILGLTRAFLGAGAAAVAVSLWLVEDEVAADIMPRWYRHPAMATDRAQALRDVQRTIRARYPHPFYWSPFIVIGQR